MSTSPMMLPLALCDHACQRVQNTTPMGNRPFHHALSRKIVYQISPKLKLFSDVLVPRTMRCLSKSGLPLLAVKISENSGEKPLGVLGLCSLDLGNGRVLQIHDHRVVEFILSRVS